MNLVRRQLRSGEGPQNLRIMRESDLNSRSPREQYTDSHLAGMFGRDFLYTAASAAQLLSAIVITPVLARILTTGEFGSFSANLALLWVIVWSTSLGLSVGITKVYSERPMSAGSVLSYAILLIGLLNLGLLLTGAWWHSALGFAQFGVTERLDIAWGYSTALTLICLAMLRAQERLAVFALVSVLQSVGSLTLGFVFAEAFAKTTEMIILGSVLMQTVSLLICLIVLRPPLIRLHDLPILKRALAFSLPLVPQQVGYFVITGADRLIVQRDLGPIATGRYQVGYNVGAVAIVLLTFLNQAWLPRVFAVTHAKSLERLLSSSRDSLFWLLIPACLGLAIGGPEALRVWAPGSFHTASLSAVMLIVTLSTAAWSASLTSTRVLLAYSRTTACALATAAAAASNILLNILMVPRFGIDGSAWATFVSYVVLAFGSAVLSRRNIRLRRVRPQLVVAMSLGFVSGWLSYYVPLAGWALALRLCLSALFGVWLATMFVQVARGVDQVSPLKFSSAYVGAHFRGRQWRD